MTIQTRDQLIDAMANRSSRIIIDKASISNAAVGQFHSLWRASGQPGAGAIPGTTPTVLDDETLGALRFNQQTAPLTSYLGILEGLCTNVGTTLEIHDRLIAMGGLVGNVTTAQNVGIDLASHLATLNVDQRKGDANYSDVQWWLEWYTNTGTTASSATVNVTYDDGSTGNLTAISLSASRRASFMQPLNSLIPAAQSGRYIRGVNTVTLTTSTGTAGNFGVTATRFRAALYQPVANARFTADWAGLGLPEIPNESALFAVLLSGSTSTGIVRATGKIIHG